VALHLTESDALFVHTPKCGGHFVESVLKHFNIAYTRAELVNDACPRHGRARDYKPAAFTFTTSRTLHAWMRSYYCFHMKMGHNKKIWNENTDYPHRVLGPPMKPWQDFVRTEVETATEYLNSMTEGCDRVIDLGDIINGLTDVLQKLGYAQVDHAAMDALPVSNPTHLLVELGGGTRARPREDLFANIDLVPEADFEWNLDVVPYPFPAQSVDEIYSSHCLEHLECPHRTFQEITRICKVGARVEIRVPHPASHMAMVAGHKHVLSPLMVENMTDHFPELHWKGPRRLVLESLTYGPTGWLQRAKEELPFLHGLDDQTIMRWIPNTAHESIFVFRVAENV